MRLWNNAKYILAIHCFQEVSRKIYSTRKQFFIILLYARITWRSGTFWWEKSTNRIRSIQRVAYRLILDGCPVSCISFTWREKKWRFESMPHRSSSRDESKKWAKMWASQSRKLMMLTVNILVMLATRNTVSWSGGSPLLFLSLRP